MENVPFWFCASAIVAKHKTIIAFFHLVDKTGTIRISLWNTYDLQFAPVLKDHGDRFLIPLYNYIFSHILCNVV